MTTPWPHLGIWGRAHLFYLREHEQERERECRFRLPSVRWRCFVLPQWSCIPFLKEIELHYVVVVSFKKEIQLHCGRTKDNISSVLLAFLKTTIRYIQLYHGRTKDNISFSLLLCCWSDARTSNSTHESGRRQFKGPGDFSWLSETESDQWLRQYTLYTGVQRSVSLGHNVIHRLLFCRFR